MAERTFDVEAIITVVVDGDARTARDVVDGLLQQAWDHDHQVVDTDQPWHFELLDGGLVTERHPCLDAGEHLKNSDHRWQECPVYHEED
jgi:hypothetical protein